MAHDVFISHSSRDKTAADATCAVLEARGIRCWIAPRDILPGADWGESIIDAINTARAFVLVFSTNANASAPVRREVERAINRGIPVIPLRIENVAPAKSLEYFISMAHWLDAFNEPLEKHLNYLADTLRHILDNADMPATRPALASLPAAASSAPSIATPTRSGVIAVAVAVLIAAGGGFAYWAFHQPGSSAAPSPVAQNATAVVGVNHDAAISMLVTDCDRLAALPGDPQKPPSVAGVMSPFQIDVDRASTACDAAMRQYPDTARFIYQAGRVAIAKKDYAEAFRLYEKAAAAGSAGAANGLGYLYENGYGVGQSWVQARAWYQTAAASGNATAMSNLGNLYYNGTGIPKDVVAARQWYAKAAASGDQYAVGMLKQIDAGK